MLQSPDSRTLKYIIAFEYNTRPDRKAVSFVRNNRYRIGIRAGTRYPTTLPTKIDRRRPSLIPEK